MTKSKSLSARLQDVGELIEQTKKARDRAPRGSQKRKAAKRRLAQLRRVRDGLRADRFKNQGSAAIIKYEVIPVLHAAGVPVTSRKRWETFGNPSSDHYMGNRDANAADGGTFSNNDKLGSEIVAALKNEESATMHGFAEFIIVRGHTGSREEYRVQVITEPHGTGPHIHIGVKRISS